jgi:hypothetical protein
LIRQFFDHDRRVEKGAGDLIALALEIQVQFGLATPLPDSMASDWRSTCRDLIAAGHL